MIGTAFCIQASQCGWGEYSGETVRANVTMGTGSCRTLRAIMWASHFLLGVMGDRAGKWWDKPSFSRKPQWLFKNRCTMSQLREHLTQRHLRFFPNPGTYRFPLSTKPSQGSHVSLCNNHKRVVNAKETNSCFFFLVNNEKVRAPTPSCSCHLFHLLE